MKSSASVKISAYTLIETLVASSVLLIGISAAASLSLSMVTQEEISERSVRAFSYLENAAALCRVGVDPSEIQNLLPPEPVVTSFTYSSQSFTSSSVGAMPITTLQIEWKPSDSSQTSGVNRWTGGDKDAKRTASVKIYRNPNFREYPRATAYP